MMKLKKIEGGMYCFLVTFDPRNEVASIVDLQAIGASACNDQLPIESETAVGHAPSSSQQILPTEKLNQAKPQSKPSSVGYVETSAILPPAGATPVPPAVEEKKPRRDYRPQDLLSRKEAADYLGIAEQTLAIWKCTKRYDVPFVKIGRLVKYKRSDLDSFIDSMKHGPDNPHRRR